MRKITIKLTEKDYFDFLIESNEHGLTPIEQVNELINYYILVRRRRLKVKLSNRKSIFD